MTIEKLLGYKTSELKAMSDEELLKIFAPYLVATRIEMQGKVHKTKKSAPSGPTKDEIAAAKDKANKMAAAMGLKPIFN